MSICPPHSLRAQMELDPNCIPALVSAITTRLFQPDNVRDKDWLLSSRQVAGGGILFHYSLGSSR